MENIILTDQERQTIFNYFAGSGVILLSSDISDIIHLIRPIIESRTKPLIEQLCKDTARNVSQEIRFHLPEHQQHWCDFDWEDVKPDLS